MKVLIIWEIVPESTDFYVVDNPTPHQLMMLEKSNNKMINSDDDIEGAEYVSNAVSDPQYVEESEHSSIWHKNKIMNEDLPNAGPFDKAFFTGFIL